MNIWAACLFIFVFSILGFSLGDSEESAVRGQLDELTFEACTDCQRFREESIRNQRLAPRWSDVNNEANDDSGSASFAYENCSHALWQMRRGEYPYTWDMIWASGKSIPLDAGNFEQCQEIPGAHYCFAEFELLESEGWTSDRTPLEVKWGLCCPEICDSRNIEKTGMHYLDFYLGAGNYSEPSVHCYDELPRDVTWNYVLSRILLGVIFGMVCVGTVLELLHVSEELGGMEPEVGDRPDPLILREEGSGREKTPLLVNETDEFSRTHSMWVTILLVFAAFFRCFSAVSNTKRLVAPTRESSLAHLNGFRVLAMIWILVGSVVLMVPGYFNHETFISKKGQARDPQFQLVVSAQYGPDTFFVIGGFLLAHLTLEAMEKRERRRIVIKGEKSAFVTMWNRLVYAFPQYHILIHRVVRLWPSLAVVAVFFSSISYYWGGGPFWFMYYESSTNTYWWATLLFVNNIYPLHFSDQFMPWTWFLALAFQFHILGSFLAFFYYSWRILTIVLTVVLVIGSISACALLSSFFDVSPWYFSADYHNYLTIIYEKPYTRAVPFLIGMLVVFLTKLLRKSSEGESESFFVPIKIHRAIRWIGSIVSLFLMICCVFVQYPVWLEQEDYPKAVNAILVSFCPVAWSVGVGWFAFLFSVRNGQYGWWFRSFFARSVWTMLARLTYGVFLVHPMIIRMISYSSRRFIMYSTADVSGMVLLMAVLAYFASYVLHLLITQPVLNVERFLFQSASRKVWKRAELLSPADDVEVETGL